MGRFVHCNVQYLYWTIKKILILILILEYILKFKL